MWRVSQIADRDGVSSAAVSKMVKRLAREHGLQVERIGDRVVAVNLAHYDELRGRHGDPSKKQGDRAAVAPLDGPNYDAEIAKKTAYDAERSRIRLEQEIGNLIPCDQVEQAMDDAGRRIAVAIDQLGGSVDVVAAAYETGGIQALRICLRDLARSTRDQVADILDAANDQDSELA